MLYLWRKGCNDMENPYKNKQNDNMMKIIDSSIVVVHPYNFSRKEICFRTNNVLHETFAKIRISMPISINQRMDEGGTFNVMIHVINYAKPEYDLYGCHINHIIQGHNRICDFDKMYKYMIHIIEKDSKRIRRIIGFHRKNYDCSNLGEFNYSSFEEYANFVRLFIKSKNLPNMIRYEMFKQFGV